MKGPTYRYGDMFEHTWNKPNTVFLVTGNGVIDRHGALVLGAGAAKQLKMRSPKIGQAFAKALEAYPTEGQRESGVTSRPVHRFSIEYGLLLLNQRELREQLGHWCRIFCDVGMFQVKHHFREKADRNLIARSVEMLDKFARKHPLTEINLNMPGTGCGRLADGVIVPLLQELPDNVNIWRRSHERGGIE